MHILGFLQILAEHDCQIKGEINREIAYAYRVKSRSQSLVRDRRILAAVNIVSHVRRGSWPGIV